jgi:ubiquinone/menaquinone biosynthesis C-methylase UbiE
MTLEALTGNARNWDDQARNWIDWAREPGLDSYWRYRPELFELVPPPGAATLDAGCGEGRLARDLAERGHRVTGIDASPTLVGAARAVHPEGDYRVADAASLPFGDGSFDLVIAYNSLMDIDDMPGAVREAARVLMPGGRYVISILHPANTGKATGQGDDFAFVVDRSYFETRLTREDAERDGVSMVFSSYRRPLRMYASALEEAGFVIEAMCEPTSGSARNVLPWHLWLRAVLAGR